MTNTFTPYVTPDEVRDVVRRFESCEFGPGEFHHREHVTVALCYLLDFTEEETLARMREGLLRFLKHHGADNAYHETITMFWIKRARHLLDRAHRSHSLVELANSVIAQCSNARLIDIHFSAERLASEEARTKWVDPDLYPQDD